MNVTIRQAVVSDAPLMDSLNRKNLPENYDILEWVVVLRSNPGMSFIALAEGKCVGYCLGLVRQRSRAEAGPVGIIASLAVDPTWRGQGIGENLLKRSINAMKRFAHSITLMVRVDNITAQKLYVKTGFQITTHIPNYYNDEKNQKQKQDGYEMTLTL